MAYLKFRKVVLNQGQSINQWFIANIANVEDNVRYTFYDYNEDNIVGEYIGGNPVVTGSNQQQQLPYGVKNKAIPDLVGKEYLGDGWYKYQTEYGVQLDYNVFNGYWRLNGETSHNTLFFRMDLLSKDLGYVTISYKYISGVESGNSRWFTLFPRIDNTPTGLDLRTNQNEIKVISNYVNDSNLTPRFFLGSINNSFSNYIFKLQIEQGDTATDYQIPLEPYLYHLEQQSNKLDGIDEGAQVNVIETIKRNNTVLTPDGNKAVNITVPTKISDLNNDSGFATGTVTQVSTGSGLTGGPITSTGTISLDTAYGDTKNPYGAKTKNTVLAGPASGSNAVPGFRALVSDDIPTLSQSKITNLTTDLAARELSANKTATWNATTNDTRYPTEKLVKSSLDGKSNTGHTHSIADITGLSTNLSNKLDKITTAGLAAYTKNGSTQSSVAIATSSTNNALVQRTANGSINVKDVSADVVTTTSVAVGSGEVTMEYDSVSDSVRFIWN